MSPSRYQAGDVLDVDGATCLVVAVAPARNSDRLRYELREGRRTFFRYVDVFDEREDVAVLVESSIAESVEEDVGDPAADGEPKADDADETEPPSDSEPSADEEEAPEAEAEEEQAEKPSSLL